MRLLMIATCLLPTLAAPVDAQSVQKKLRAALLRHEHASTVKEQLAALEDFREICARHPGEWLASYWTAYLCTQAARLSRMSDDFPKDVKTKDLVTEAIQRLDDARKAKGKMKPAEKSDFHALRGFICDFEHMVAGRTGHREINDVQVREYQAALRENPDNPLMQVLIAVEMINEASKYQDVVAARALLDTADATFQQAEDRSRTTYWAREFVSFWKSRADQRLEGFLK